MADANCGIKPQNIPQEALAQLRYRQFAVLLRLAIKQEDTAWEAEIRGAIAELDLPHCMWPESCDAACRIGSAFCESHYGEVAGYSEVLNAQTAQPCSIH